MIRKAPAKGKVSPAAPALRKLVPVAPLPSEHVDAELSNGLRIVCVPRPASQRAVMGLLLRVGSRYESEADNGISHFLEHMLYRGSPSFKTAHDQALAFERLGGTLYAATQTDHGVMSLALPPESLDDAVQLFAEVAQYPRLTSLETERGIVREEILEDLDEDGHQVDADNLARALMYRSHPLGFTITGSLAQLDRFDRPLLERHHARHYTAANAVLVFSGAIDPDACVRAAERGFGSMPRGSWVETPPPAMTQKRPRTQHVPNLSSQTEVRLAFRAPGDHDRREPAVEMLLRVLDDGMSTRLYERICDSLGLCYDVSALFESYEDDGVLDIAAEAAHARAGEVVSEILAIVESLADHGPTTDEIDKAKLRHAWQMRAMLDDAESLAGFYGLTTLAGIARTPRDRHEQLMAVGREDVRDVAREIFKPERMSLVTVGSLPRDQQKAVDDRVKAFAGR